MQGQQNSSANDDRNGLLAMEDVPKRTVSNIGKQLPFNKCSSVPFLKLGSCHMCKMRNKLVYQCFRDYQTTSCEKKFCYDCLLLIYKDNIIETIQVSDVWRCPYMRKVCRCKGCCLGRKEGYGMLELDSSQSVYANLRQRQRSQEWEEDLQVDENKRYLMREKTKKLVQFNGQLINKVNTNYHKLSEEEIKFYHKLIHSNLTVLNAISKNMVTHETIIEE